MPLPRFFPLARRSNHGLSGEFANRPSSRAFGWLETSVVRYRVSLISKRFAKVATRRQVATARHFWCQPLGYVSHAPLGLGFNGSLWFCRQLQNRGLLALIQSCQERDPAIRKFQRIVMRCCAKSGHRLIYSITSSARASSDGGIDRPRALAVLRLITKLYLVGACTGRSAGFSPLRMRSTYEAACRD